MSSSDEIEIVEERDKKSTNKKMTKSGKLKRTIASMIVLPDKEELANRKMVLRGADLFEDFTIYLKCTKCCVKLTNNIQKGRDVLLHPALGVLFCKKCSKWYAGDDDWSVDEDEEDKYCRWCGEGGRIFLCSKCTCGFCSKCIKMHLGKASVADIEADDNWKCLICYPVPLWHLRHIAHLAVEVANENQKVLKNKLEEKPGRKQPKRRIIVQEDSSDTDKAKCKASDTDDSAFKKRPGPRSKTVTCKGNDKETAKRPGPKNRTRSQSGSESKGDITRSRAQTRDDSVSSSEGKPSRNPSKYRERSASEECEVAKKSVCKSRAADEDDDWDSKRPGPRSKTNRKSDSESSDRLPPRKKSRCDRSASEDSNRAKPKAKPGPKSKTRRSDSEISDRQPARRSSRVDRSACEDSSRTPVVTPAVIPTPDPLGTGPHSSSGRSLTTQTQGQSLRSPKYGGAENLILGSSLTRGLKNQFIRRQVYVACRPGATIASISNEVRRYKNNEVIKKLILHVGGNDVANLARNNLSPDEIVMDYWDLTLLCKEKFPKAEITVNSILWRRGFSYRLLKAVNAGIAWMCRAQEVYFLDLKSSIRNIHLRYDGVHLNAEGSVVLAQLIRARIGSNFA